MRDRRRQLERRAYYEEPDLLVKLDNALDRVDTPTRDALIALRNEYTIFAKRNQHRLQTLGRNLMIGGIIVFVIQFSLGLFGLHLQFTSSKLSQDNRHTLAQVQDGRHVSLEVTCAVESAISQAGRSVITGSTVAPPPKQERALEDLGFPPFAVRHQQAEAAADGYVNSISKMIDKSVGSKGDGLIQHNGTINCDKLADLAKVGH